MNEKILDGIQNTTKTVVTVGTTVGIFSVELALLGATVPFHGAAKLIAAISKAGKLFHLPPMVGGLTVMISSSALVGSAAGEAVDYCFDMLRGKNSDNMIPAQRFN